MICSSCLTLTLASEAQAHKRTCTQRQADARARASSAAPAPRKRQRTQHAGRTARVTTHDDTDDETSAPSPVLSLQWALDEGTNARAVLDGLTVNDILSHQLFVVKAIRYRNRTPVLECFNWAEGHRRDAVEKAALTGSAADLQTADSWHKLCFLLPCLLLLPDGGNSLSRTKRIKLFHEGDLNTLV